MSVSKKYPATEADATPSPPIAPQRTQGFGGFGGRLGANKLTGND